METCGRKGTTQMCSVNDCRQSKCVYHVTTQLFNYDAREKTCCKIIPSPYQTRRLAALHDPLLVTPAGPCCGGAGTSSGERACAASCTHAATNIHMHLGDCWCSLLSGQTFTKLVGQRIVKGQSDGLSIIDENFEIHEWCQSWLERALFEAGDR